MDDAPGRLAATQALIRKAASRFDTPARAVQLVAVSKTVPAERIASFITAGQTVFGENRVQEAREKWPALRERHPGLELHLIGPLQTNKARDAVALFDVIQSLDRDRLAGVLAAEMKRAGRWLPCFVQVNIGLEEQKAGIAPGETEAFVRRCREEHGLAIEGLMCIPPEGVPPGPYFAHLATLGRECAISNLSMGMSVDFEVAIAMGATHVRVGSALFGHRTSLL